MIGLADDSLETISMESAEEESGEKHYPSLPPNYVSLRQLQERWLQRQKEKQETEEQEKKGEQKQPKPEGGLINASRGQQEKGRKKFGGKEAVRERNGWRRVEGGQKVYRPKGALHAKRPEIGVAEGELKSGGFEAKTLAHHGVDTAGGMEGKIVTRKKKKKNRKERVARVEGSLAGELDNKGNLGYLSRRNGRGEGCGEEFGINGSKDTEVEGKVSMRMIGVVPENNGKEVTGGDMGGNCGGDKGFGEQDWGYSGNWEWGESSSECIPEGLPAHGSGKEVPAAENWGHQGMLEAGSVNMVEVLPENKAEEDSAITVGRKGKGRLRAWHRRNVHNSSRWRVSTDSKLELECENNVMDKCILGKETEKSGHHKGGNARGMQAYGDKEMVSGNQWPKVRRDLRFLSLDESRVGNVALRRGRDGFAQRRYEKSRNVEGLVWMKKGEISDTNITEI